MEQHDGMVDQPDDGPQDGTNDERWETVKDRFGDLGSKLRGFYDDNAEDSDESPTEEMRDAVQTFVAAAERIGKTIQDAFNDPEVQDTAKGAFNSLINALTDTFRDAGSQISEEFDELTPGADEEE